MPTAAQAQGLARTAGQLLQELDATARTHKRQERQHREAARSARRRHEELLAFCRAAGIPVVNERTRA